MEEVEVLTSYFVSVSRIKVFRTKLVSYEISEAPFDSKIKYFSVNIFRKYINLTRRK